MISRQRDIILMLVKPMSRAHIQKSIHCSDDDFDSLERNHYTVMTNGNVRLTQKGIEYRGSLWVK